MHHSKGRGPRRRRREDPEAAERAAFREKVQKLEQSMGLEKPLAVRVARGELSLSEAVETMARKDRVEALVRRHGFSRALASQIALGHADLDYHLRKLRLAQHLEEHGSRSVLDEAAADGELRLFGLHGHRQVRARVAGLERFHVVLAKDGQEVREHKLQAKYVVAAGDAKKLNRVLKWDAAQKAVTEPIKRPQDRYALSDRRLFSMLDREMTVAVTLLEGEVLRGVPVWMSRYELGLVLKGKLQVTVLRHAIADLREA